MWSAEKDAALDVRTGPARMGGRDFGQAVRRAQPPTSPVSGRRMPGRDARETPTPSAADAEVAREAHYAACPPMLDHVLERHGRHFPYLAS